jgi:hypothetical protein
MIALLDMEFGALTICCVIAAVFFLRYWATTRDRFFLWFAGAFLTFAINWVLIGFRVGGEHTHVVFIVRLVGFLLIIAAIVGKNAAPEK